MDLGHDFSDNKTYKKGYLDREKKCTECNKDLEKTRHHLYFQGFCSQECKDKYIDAVKFKDL